ncbi:hypothetical protein LQ954_03315 [Sphingomonas sp. IC-11]|uniref:hypothetical protein n=1 Tax=Sphingomonas sp. IC-11 TaxID=2898528 RepID=UPI001E505A7F|nr:hypothetical protein [Sphingomonas sp. IC-11]MCD2315177.1 hypothetical protein [Sphingomonas sp. IC-11]
MWRDVKQLYADGAAFALALPILFSIPVVIEFAQHVVEIDLGFYQHGLTASAAFDQRRLTLGFAKVLALLLPGYWFVRFIAWNRDARRAKRIERPAATLFGVQFGIQAAWQWLALFGPPIGVVLGLAPRLSSYAELITTVGVSVVAVYLAAWLVAWPLGNAQIGPLRSIAIMAGSFWRTVAYMVAGALPLMALHYVLGYGAIGRPEWLVWIMMAADALVVGFLALTTVGAAYLAAKRAADRRGVSLRDGAPVRELKR